MAMQGSVDFVISAKDLTSKPTTDIINALNDLSEAQKRVVDTSDDLTQSSSRLRDEQKALVDVSNELDKRLADVSKYEKNKESLDGLTSKLADTKTKFEDLTRALSTAKETGQKTAIKAANDDLKATAKVISDLQRQITSLTNKQEGLQSRIKNRSGQDVASGDGTARATLQAAKDQVGVLNQQNTAAQRFNQYLVEQGQEEARNLALAKEHAAFQQQLDSAAESNRRNEYETMYGNLLDKNEKRTRETKKWQDAATTAVKERAEAEKKAADELERFQQIGERAKNVLDVNKQNSTTTAASPTSGTASSAVKGVLDPLAAQVSTLTGLEKALEGVDGKIKEVGASSADAKTKVESLKDVQSELATVGKNIATQAGLVDALNKQISATDIAKTRMSEAEAEVEKFANQIKNATVADDKLVISLQGAQGRLQGATSAFRTQEATLGRVKAQAAAAGIDVDHLKDAENRLTEAARRTSTSQNEVSTALQNANKGATGFLASLDKFNRGSGRTSLSLFQRMRGEILSITASFVGIQAGFNALGSTLDAVKTDQAVRSQIAQTSENPQQAASQYQFLQSEATRTAFSFESVAKAYALMVRQAREYGLSQNAINVLFSDSLTTARSYNQTQEQLEGTMLALGQIFDKTTIQSEEFKKQLSNVGLAGLFPTLAKVMQDKGVKSVNDVRKAMVDANIPAAEMVGVMHALAEAGKVAFEQNMQTWQAQVGKFSTQLYNLKLQFAQGGFLEGVSEGLNQVSQTLADPKVQQGLRDFGKNLGEIIAWLAKVATNADLMKKAFDALVLFIEAKMMFSLLGLIGRLIVTAGTLTATGATAAAAGRGFLALSAAAGAATASFTAMALAYTAAAGLGFVLGKMISNIPVVKRQLDDISNSSFWDLAKNGRGFAILTKSIQGLTEATLAWMNVGDIQGSAERTKQLQAETAAIRLVNQAKRDGTAVTKEQQAAADAAMAAAKARSGAPTVSGVPAAAAGGLDDAAAILEKDRLSNQQALERANDATAKLNDKARQKELRSLKDYQKLYEDQYKGNLETLERIRDQFSKGADSGNIKDLQGQMDAEKSIAALKLAIKNRADADYADANRKTGEKISKQGDSFEKRRADAHARTNQQILSGKEKLADLGAKLQTDSLDKRLAAVDVAIAKEQAKYEDAIRKNDVLINEGTKLGKDTTSLVQDNASLQASIKKLDVAKEIAKTLATQKFHLDEQDAAEQKIEDKLRLRVALLAAIAAQLKANKISPQEADTQIKQVNTDTVTGPQGVDGMIDLQIASLNKLILTQQDAGNSGTKYTATLEEMRAKLVQLRAETDLSATSTNQLATTIGTAFGGAVTTSLNSFVSEIGKAGAGVESLGSAWKNLSDSVRNAVADMLQQIAIYIIKMQIVKALQSASKSAGGGLWGSILGSAASAIGGGSSAHTGAVVGAGGLGGATPRNVNPAWFIGAPRYHTGGMAGLAPDEYPIIAQKGEEIITKNDPRNRANGGTTASSEVGKPGGDVNLHVHADAASFFSAGLQSRQGQTDFWTFITANRSKLQKLTR